MVEGNNDKSLIIGGLAIGLALIGGAAAYFYTKGGSDKKKDAKDKPDETKKGPETIDKKDAQNAEKQNDV